MHASGLSRCLMHACAQRVHPISRLSYNIPRRLELNFALGANVAALQLPPLALHFNPQKVLVIDRNSTGRFEVLGGNGGDIKVLDRDLVLIQPIFDDFLKWVPTTFSDSFVIQDDPQPYTVKSGTKLGEAELEPDCTPRHPEILYGATTASMLLLLKLKAREHAIIG